VVGLPSLRQPPSRRVGHLRASREPPEVARIGDDATLSREPNAVLEKILMFRDVPPADANTCRRDREYDYRNGS